MDRIGMAVGPYTLSAPVEVPEAGDWYAARRLEGEGPVWVRLRAGDEDERAVEMAWERVRYLEHDLVPRVRCYDRPAGALAMGAPAGVSLQKVLDHRQEPEMVMTPATVLAVGVALADLIVTAHERGRPHGHLAPSQVWVSPLGELVVWGYGVGPDAPPHPTWCAPERARGRRASGDADQWALGALLAALITGRVPWRGDDPLAEARVGDATHLWSPVMDQWKPLGRVLERALAPEARDRFPSAHPMRQALQALQQRVRHGDDLARIGAQLAERHGLPGPSEAFADVQRRTSVAAPLPVDPAQADGPGWVAAEAPSAEPVQVPSSSGPAWIPSATSVEDDVPTVANEGAGPEDVESDALRPLSRALDTAGPPTSPTAVPEGDEPGAASWEEISPRTDDGEPYLSNRIPVEPAPPEASLDIRAVAPWVVGTMVAVVAGFLLAQVW